MKIKPEELKKVAIEILKGFQATEEEAAVVAECLIHADRRGIDTHGVYFLTLLAKRVKEGMIQIPTHIEIVRDDSATGLIDGGNGLGQVAAHRAMEMSIEKARRFGMGSIAVRNTNHIGILAFYTLRIAEQGMVGIVMCNGAASMPPWGGAEPFFGTNPISFSLPGSGEPVVLDMSSSLVARGKIRRAERMKESIPLGWALDQNGEPTTDPSAAMKGTLVPIGGPKGYGLALMVDVLAGLLSGSQFGPQVKTFHQPLGPTGVGVLIMAIDVNRFMPIQQFKRLMESYGDSIKKSRKAKGVSRIYLPGEIESEKDKKSLAEGIELSDSTTDSLNQLLEEVRSPLKLQ
ncbi:MAG TPA: Ldh family oxidoreductase [Thermodesulfobacteriota bacterium]|nr:Ldh family oxidoreductase [Thermodesulfobacteriota bacterium]